MSDFSVITDRDMRLLQAVFRAAREEASAGDLLQRALDEFDLRASFQVPQA